MEQKLEIPADVNTVTLELKKEKNSTFTLRSLLPQIKDIVELVMDDVFDKGSMRAVDRYKLRAMSGVDLQEKLERSRLVNGELILGLVPDILTDEESNAIRLIVKPYVPGKEA